MSSRVTVTCALTSCAPDGYHRNQRDGGTHGQTLGPDWATDGQEQGTNRWPVIAPSVFLVSLQAPFIRCLVITPSDRKTKGRRRQRRDVVEL